jgi:excisionase family DNA binding protein
MTTKPLLTPADVAVRLKVKLRTAYDMLAPGGKLHHLRIDLGHKTVRIDPDKLEQFIKEGAPYYAGI